MTTGLFAPFPLAVGHELHLELGRTRAIILALFATLCIASVTSVTVQVFRFAAANSTARASDLVIGTQDDPAATPPAPAIAREALPEIEALATLVAKKYRIAPEVTRRLVATTYREGQRIGLDPLLIIAVIAVESRFNPIAQSDGGAQGLMQVIPGYHKDHFEAARVDSMLDPHANIRLGARVLKEYIGRGGTEVAGLQLYNGSADDASNAYATKVLGEKGRLRQVVQRVRGQVRT